MEFPDHTRTRYWSCFSFILVAYLCAYGALLIYTDFLPYILDNNESFSAFVHGENLYKFGLSDSLGLTDEAYGPNPGAHPYVYTHQGNFPRLFTVLLYALGLRTVESQIAITTFTIGLGTVYLIYHLFARLWNPTFALIVSLVFMSDYLLFAQWQMNTFKVWHAFFVFFSLVCIQHFYGRRQRLWSLLLVLSFAAIFYYDLMMAAFTFALSLSFACFLHYKRGLKSVIRIGALPAIGAVAGVGALVLQLTAYYGWQTFKTDAYLTFVARNAPTVSQISLATFEDFFTKHKIVFWYNFIDGGAYTGLKPFVQSIFRYGFAIYTPYLAFLILLIFSAIVVRFYLRPIVNLLRGTHGLFALNKAALFVLCAILIGAFALIWPSNVLLSAVQLLFLVLLILPALFVNRFSLRRLVAILVFCRTHKVQLLMLLAFIQNVLLLHTSSDRAVLNRYSPQYALLFSALCATGALFIHLIMWDGDQHRKSAASLSIEKSAALEVFRTLDKITVSFVLYFSIGLFLALALSSYRFELTTGPPAFLSNIADVNTGLAFPAACILLVTGFAIAAVWADGVFSRVLLPRSGADCQRTLLRRVVLILFVSAFCFFGWMQHELYFLPNLSLAPIWGYIRSPWTAYHLSTIVLILAVGLACIIILHKPFDAALASDRTGLRCVLIYLACVAMAYLTGYMLSPGYTSVINLQRYSPLLVFFLAPLLGTTLYVLYLIATLPKQAASEGRRQKWLLGRITSKLSLYTVRGSAGVVLVFLVVYWIGAQVSYFELFPPTYASFLKKLAKPPYHGASFVTSTYAAPTAVQTGQWAYLDPVFLGSGEYALNQRGYIKTGTNAYLWLADRDNPIYEQPRYAICHMTPGMPAALTKLELIAKLHTPSVKIRDLEAPAPELAKRLASFPERTGCGQLNIPYFANDEKYLREVRFRLRERDPSPFYNWAIVELETDFPPYLLEFSGQSGTYVALHLVRGTATSKLRISYRYHQQQGRAEGDSKLKVTFIPSSSDNLSGRDIHILYDGPAVPTVPLDHKLKGYLFAAVTPRSTTREGRTYLSEALWIGQKPR